MDVRTAYLFDFDGTITLKDTSELVLEQFAEGDWRTYDKMMDRGEISLEKCMKEQFRLVTARPQEILRYLDGKVRIREGFVDIVEFLIRSGHKVAIVSAGLDFVIEHHLRSLGISGRIEVICGRSSFNDHIEFDFPPVMDRAALDFKQDMVIRLRSTHDRIEYFGDGSSDYNAARSSDHCFSVRGSRLDRLCHEEDIEYTEFDDFTEIAMAMKN